MNSTFLEGERANHTVTIKPMAVSTVTNSLATGSVAKKGPFKI
jgi:hypothetical protein